MPGLARSAGVIERMIASTRSSSPSSTSAFFSCFIAPIPGSIPIRPLSGPIFRTWRICWRKSSSVNWSFFSLSCRSERLLLVDLLLGFLDQAEDVAHAEDARGHAVGVELVEVLQLLAGRGEEDRLAGHRVDRERGAAAGVAVELGHHHAVELGRLGEGLGDADGVLAGHRVDDEEDVVRAASSCGSAPARPSGPGRCGGGRRCRRSARRGARRGPAPAPRRRSRPGRRRCPARRRGRRRARRP